jgi:DNA-binding transcriptional LysR family regulator
MCALVLAEEGNLGRTAERLHTSHSNVGRKVKTLQSAWGVELFRRSLTGFELTDEGRFAVREIRKSIEHVQRGFDHAIYLSVKRRRPLLVGHSLYIQEKVLPWLQRQSTSGTEFSRLELKADTTVHLMTRVLRGQLHIGFGAMPIQDKDLWIESLGHEYFGVCIPADHPFKSKVRLSARDLVNETIHWMPRSVHPALYRQVHVIESAGFSRNSGRDQRTLSSASRTGRTLARRKSCIARESTEIHRDARKRTAKGCC